MSDWRAGFEVRPSLLESGAEKVLPVCPISSE